MIFKPKIRQPKRRSATEGEGEKGSVADGRSVSTAGAPPQQQAPPRG